MTNADDTHSRILYVYKNLAQVLSCLCVASISLLGNSCHKDGTCDKDIQHHINKALAVLLSENLGRWEDVD